VSSLSPDMRCERCFHSLPPNETHCPNCGLVVPKATPGGKALGMAGKYAPRKTREEQAAIAQRELRGQIIRESISGIPKKGFHENPVVIAVLAVLFIVVGGAVGWGFREAQFAMAPPPDEATGAIRLVSRATAKGGGTVEKAAGLAVSKLADQGKVEAYPGWSAVKEGNRWRVRFTVKEKGQEPRAAEWTVDLAQKSVQPENDWARQLAK
jgi:hypothetical protein